MFLMQAYEFQVRIAVKDHPVLPPTRDSRQQWARDLSQWREKETISQSAEIVSSNKNCRGQQEHNNDVFGTSAL